MFDTPSRAFLALIPFDCDLDLPQDLFAGLAHRHTKSGNGAFGVEIEDTQKILVLEVVLQAAAGQQRIGDADRGGVLKCRAYVKGIIPLQEGAVNVVEDVILVVGPVFPRKPGGDLFQLLLEAVFAGDCKTPLQCRRHHVPVFLPVLPEVGVQAVAHAPGVRHIEHIAQDGPAPAGVDQGNALGAAPYVPPHPLVPEVPLRTGGSVRTLGVDHQLLREGVFLKILSRGNVRLSFYLLLFYSFKGNRRHSYRGAAVIISIISAVPPNHSPGL